MRQEAIGTNRSEEWETPQELFDALSEEFGGFDLDPCATAQNAKCEKFFSIKENGLMQDWTPYKKIFMNPPYGRGVGDWIRKAYETSLSGSIIVCLLFVRTDTAWFHDWVYGKAEIRFIRGRLKFGKSKQSAPFPSMLVIYRDNKLGKSEIY